MTPQFNGIHQKLGDNSQFNPAQEQKNIYQGNIHDSTQKMNETSKLN